MANGDHCQGNKMRSTMNYHTAKKPKLMETNVVPTSATAADDLWGEDLTLDAVDECFFLASQICPSLNTTVTPSPSANVAASVKDMPVYKPNVLQNLSNGVREEKEKDALKMSLKKLEDDNKKWKERLFTKDGEVLILRRQLKQSEAKGNTLIQIKSREYEDKIKAMQKELDKAKTTMEFQKLEAWKATDRLLLAQSSQCVPHVPELVCEPVPEVGTKDEILIFKSKVNQSSGSILNDLLNPHLFCKSDLEIHQVKLESKFSLQVSTTNKKKISWRPSLYPLRLSVESCWVSVNQLGLEDSFQTMKAKYHIRNIFTECREILYDLLITLRDRAKEETLEELDRRDRHLIETPVESLDNPKLLSNKMWYDVERGLEARRSLGLLSAICMLSEHMSNLVCGVSTDEHGKSKTINVVCSEYEDVESLNPAAVNEMRNFVFVENKIIAKKQAMVNSLDMEVDVVMGKNNLSTKEANKTNSPETEKIVQKEKEMRNSYEQQQFGFLRLLQSLTQIIGDQRNAFDYSGFLTGVVILLTRSLFKGSYTEKSNAIVSDIIRAVVFSRPRVETVVALSKLLYAFSSNQMIMESLCQRLESKAYIDIACGLGYFRTNSCVIQILCWLLEKRNTSVRSRTRLCRGVVNWVWANIKRRPHRGPKWAQCKSANGMRDPCFCRGRLAEVTVKLIYQTYKDFERYTIDDEGEFLRKTLVRGLMLLHQLTETDPEFGMHMQEAEGSYQWLLIGLRNTPHDLCLDKYEDGALRELLAMEDATEPRPFAASEKTQQHFLNICSSMKLCWSDQTISHNLIDIID